MSKDKKIKTRILENELNKLFIDNIPEIKDYIIYPVDESKDYDYNEKGLGQDADIVEIQLLIEDLLAYFEKQVSKNDNNKIELFLKTVSIVKDKFIEKVYSKQSVYDIFEEHLFYMVDNLNKNEEDIVLKNMDIILKERFIKYKNK